MTREEVLAAIQLTTVAQYNVIRTKRMERDNHFGIKKHDTTIFRF